MRRLLILALLGLTHLQLAAQYRFANWERHRRDRALRREANLRSALFYLTHPMMRRTRERNGT